MGVIVSDIIEGSSVRKTRDGWYITRVILVKELSGEGMEKIKNAVENTSGVPSIGDVHPVFSDTFLREIEPRIIDSDNVSLFLTYEPNPYNHIEYEVGADAVSVESNTDVNGEDLWVEYTYPSNYPDEKYAGLTDRQGIIYSRLVPDKTFTVRRRMMITRADLMEMIDEYQNHVNASGWSMDMSAPAGSWLCTEIRGRNDPIGGYYAVSFTFKKRQPFKRGNTVYPGWADTFIYIDPNTGKPPPPEEWGENTIKVIMNYPEADFDELDLD